MADLMQEHQPFFLVSLSVQNLRASEHLIAEQRRILSLINEMWIHKNLIKQWVKVYWPLYQIYNVISMLSIYNMIIML